MKPRRAKTPTMPPRKRPVRSGAGGGGTRKPTPGWKGLGTVRLGWRNPRTPAVPATLNLTLDEYFAAATVMGLLASQIEEPDPQWCCDWSFKMGRTMAREAHRRRNTGRRPR
jgi:hypothetical protein